MDGKELKAHWRNGTSKFGAWITLNDPAAAAVVCNTGYEWLLIDAEHNPFNPESIRHIFNTIRMRNAVPIVRVTDNNPALIKQMLDWGAEGIIVPLIKSASDAQQAVSACHYPPHGIRGFNPRDVSNYYQELAEYAGSIEERVICMLMIENIEAVENLEEILKVPGIDSVLIGPADLSYSLGCPLQTDSPDLNRTIDTIISKCNAAHIPVGIAIEGTAESFYRWIQKGIDFLPLGMDYKWIKTGGGHILHQMQELIKPG